MHRRFRISPVFSWSCFSGSCSSRSRFVHLIFGLWVVGSFLCSALMGGAVPAKGPATEQPVREPGRFTATADSVTSLGGYWRFQQGDDPAWADPAFDDASWPGLEVPATWKSAGIGDARFGWYRIRVSLEGRPAGGWGIAFGRVFSAFELYANGRLVAHAGEFPPHSVLHYDQLRVWSLAEFSEGTGPPGSPSEVTLALRVYSDPVDPGGGGVVRGPIEIGGHDTLLRRYARWDLDRLLLAAIFICAGLYHLYLYSWRPQLKIYLWFGLFSLAFSSYSLLISQWRFVLSDNYAELKRWEFIAAFLLVYMSMRFVWLLLESHLHWPMELYLSTHLLAVVACVLTPSLHHHLKILLWWLPWAILGVIWMSYRVVRAWWMGHPEGKAIGLGFSITVVTFIHDLFLAQGWITGTALSTYGFAAFAATMAISLAGRFNRVHRELDHLRRGLEERVQERTLELEEARDAAEHASLTKSRFLAHMSHEIRTPMNGVLGVMDLLARTQLQPLQQRYLDLIRSSAEMLLRVINDVLDLSRIESGRVTILEEAFDLYRLCDELTGLARLEAEGKGLELSLRIDPRIPRWVEGDPARLRQVLGNLISNAVKFTDQGSVKVSLAPLEMVRMSQQPSAPNAPASAESTGAKSTEPTGSNGSTGSTDSGSDEDSAVLDAASPSVQTATTPWVVKASPSSSDEEVESSRTGAWIRFRIDDTGMGMDEKTLKRLFQPFEQGDSSTQRRFGGTGLGLVIAQRVVESAGGWITVRSTQGEGSTFFVDLPLPATEEPVQSIDGGTLTLRRGARILLVEDDPINRVVAASNLENLGAEVFEAEDGESALELLSSNSFDLVFMDCQLPGVDGYEATRRWRSLEGSDQHLPIFALTAHAVDGERERCLAAGMDDFLTKPLRFEDLQRVLSPWLEASQGDGATRVQV